MFSSHAGAPTDKPLLDSDPKLYETQKTQRCLTTGIQEVGKHSPVQGIRTHVHKVIISQVIDANNFVIEESEKYGTRSYIFVPCIVCKPMDPFLDVG